VRGNPHTAPKPRGRRPEKVWSSCRCGACAFSLASWCPGGVGAPPGECSSPARSWLTRRRPARKCAASRAKARPDADKTPRWRAERRHAFRQWDACKTKDCSAARRAVPLAFREGPRESPGKPHGPGRHLHARLSNRHCEPKAKQSSGATLQAVDCFVASLLAVTEAARLAAAREDGVRTSNSSARACRRHARSRFSRARSSG
jgi:hypothetical protein